MGGPPKSSATSPVAASSLPLPTSAKNSAATSASIPNQRSPFAGPIPIPPAESALTKSPGQLTSLLFFNLLAKVPVDKFLREVHTPELHELGTLIQTAIQWKAYLPGARK